jgi:hypothetical protein
VLHCLRKTKYEWKNWNTYACEYMECSFCLYMCYAYMSMNEFACMNLFVYVYMRRLNHKTQNIESQWRK